jgi:hypothetical protein
MSVIQYPCQYPRRCCRIARYCRHMHTGFPSLLRSEEMAWDHRRQRVCLLSIRPQDGVIATSNSRTGLLTKTPLTKLCNHSSYYTSRRCAHSHAGTSDSRGNLQT